MRKFQKKRIRKALLIVSLFFLAVSLVCVKAVLFSGRATEELASQYNKRIINIYPRGRIYDINSIPFSGRENTYGAYSGLTLFDGRADVAKCLIGEVIHDEYSTTASSVSGISGLEYHYDAVLNGGTPIGVYANVDAEGSVLADYGYSVSNDHLCEGGRVYTTIDYHIQKSAEQICERFFAKNECRGVAVILTDCATSGITALVSVGSEMNKVFLSYQPGSVMKILTAAAALEEGLISPDTPYTCTGVVTPDGIERYCSSHAVHGETDMKNAFAVSCNCCFYELGKKLLYADESGLTKSKMLDLAARLGFGIYPNKSCLRFFMEYDEHFSFVPEGVYNEMDLFNVTLGQGNVQASPYLINLMTTAVANGGSCVKTHLITGVTDAAGNQIETKETGVYDMGLKEQTVSALQQMMRQTGISGYASENSLPFDVAGKTGTSESVESADYHAWFTGYFPSEQPRYSLTVLVEEGGYSSVAFSLFEEIAMQVNSIMPSEAE